MTKAQHTPGPWSYSEKAVYGNLPPFNNIGPKVCNINEGSEYGIAFATAQANARLIAAAPVMAKAIYKLLTARKESTQAFTKASYSTDVQAVFDTVEAMF